MSFLSTPVLFGLPDFKSGVVGKNPKVKEG
jgi:hypothetical protein